MVISGLYRPSFFSQIAAAILFKKKNRAPSKIPYKIHNQKNQTASCLALWQKSNNFAAAFT